MKHKIVIRDWSYDCGEPMCCSDYGTELTVNGECVDQYFTYDEVWLKEFLEALGITDYEIEVIQEEYDDL